MSIFGWLKSFIKNLFNRARPALEDFLKENLEEIKRQIEVRWPEIEAEGFHAIKQKLHAVIKARFPFVADTHISIALDFAYDHLKREIEERIRKELGSRF